MSRTASPLRFSDLSSSGIDDSTSLAEVLSARADLEVKLAAAKTAHDRYVRVERDLEERINDIDERAEITLQLLEDRKSALIEENERVCEELDALPDMTFLQEQLYLLRENERRRSAASSNVIEAGELVRLGILVNGEGTGVLLQRVEAMIREIEAGERKSPMRSPRRKLLATDDERMGRQISLLRQANRVINTKTGFEITTLESEVARLRLRLVERRKVVQSRSVSRRN